MSAVYSSFSGSASAARSFAGSPNADRPSMKGNVSELRTSPAPADAHPSRPVSSEPLLTPRVRCAAQPPEDDVEVRPEDQKAINTFGRLNNRKNDIEEEIKEKQQFHDLLDDASNEIILADDDEPVRCANPNPQV
jgi:hypothetical protein